MHAQTNVADFYRRSGHESFGDEPMYAAICLGIADDRDMLDLLAAHAPASQQPNLLLAAAHYLLLGGLDHPLGDIYYGGSSSDPAAAFVDMVLANRDQVDELLATKHTQTNEVGRCSVLALALNQVSAEAGVPMSWIDLGTSGGLNLGIDRFGIDYRIGDEVTRTGSPDAAVTVNCEIRDGQPVALAEVAKFGWRAGVDRAPIDVTDPDQARWLQACLWPSQPERMQRLRAAIDVAVARPPLLLQGDAVEGLELALTQAPADAPVVVTTTWVWYYLPKETKAGVLDVMRNATRQLWWVSLEGVGVVSELGESSERHLFESSIGVLAFEGGALRSAEVLGHCHPHGAWIDWHR